MNANIKANSYYSFKLYIIHILSTLNLLFIYNRAYGYSVMRHLLEKNDDFLQ